MSRCASLRGVGLQARAGSRQRAGHAGRGRPEAHAQRRAPTVEHHPLGRLSAVGRLDKETTGLLLLTDDGHLSERVLRPVPLKV